MSCDTFLLFLSLAFPFPLSRIRYVFQVIVLLSSLCSSFVLFILPSHSSPRCLSSCVSRLCSPTSFAYHLIYPSITHSIPGLSELSAVLRFMFNHSCCPSCVEISQKFFAQRPQGAGKPSIISIFPLLFLLFPHFFDHSVSHIKIFKLSSFEFAQTINDLHFYLLSSQWILKSKWIPFS